ncbi:MAG: hypothetical protein ABJC36_12925 [Gemmatimonadales bacterium]
MTADLGLAAGRSLSAGAIVQARLRDRRFFTGMAVAALLTAVIGFAPTYYLRSMVGGPPLSTLLHVHGLLFTAWLLLFLAQTSLVAAQRTDLHRRLGLAVVILAPLLLVVGWLTAIDAARRGVTPPGGPHPLAFLAVPLGTLVVFAMLVIPGLRYRRRSETHKRLMLLATISLLTPAIARFRYYGLGGTVIPIVGTCAFVLVCMAYDRWSHGRVHPVLVWGGVLLMISLPGRFALGQTGAWRSIAEWLTR